jgi:hypothetical protein
MNRFSDLNGLKIKSGWINNERLIHRTTGCAVVPSRRLFFKMSLISTELRGTLYSYSGFMRSMTLLPLIFALILALLTFPALFIFLPVGLACGLGSVLLTALALPGLVEQDASRDEAVS